ncbi:DeoR/GlpR family DNA-binding transcription regulator [Actinoalloteichus hymeniacidonis]|uniref:Transcriptional regulator, DeoR family n=1 Tax=Actinoalloteichus hymeniacidonis TaxID=340345 RepID=A0AAC9MWP1_9PSEU|nr:DeoR/GlpR family DNA-binding transcription regulator [Actinoalloteichus hymeniacidonis]AOS61022.1 transcriptional regulator, DeoR family [Actinoalloteichus hymeniacidonis]MBB5910978.1 DeoR/GlpR family transcriptional regulator of sugar metabolism [Actinoalloteichus hymeniacidonis]
MPRDSEIRRKSIVQMASSGLANVEELSERFGVTASTIRRDLAQLERSGALARTYGGAMALVAHPESSLRQRVGEQFDAKRGIARWAARQIGAGETVLLDAGTTTGALAHELRAAPALTVVTTGMTALQELAASDSVTVECLGGVLRPRSLGFIGPLAEAALERRTFDRVFLGADGVTAKEGICEADIRQTRLKELMARRSDRVYLLAHGAKVGRRPFHAWAPMPAQWTLVTDRSASEEALEPFRARGVDVIVTDINGEVTSAVGAAALAETAALGVELDSRDAEPLDIEQTHGVEPA